MKKSEIIKKAEEMYLESIDVKERLHYAQVLFSKENGKFSVHEHVDSSSYVPMGESDIEVFIFDIEHSIPMRHEFDYPTKEKVAKAVVSFLESEGVEFE